ncbi:phage baseplate assembly protein V [Geodermatophilus sp. SYSU D00804]
MTVTDDLIGSGAPRHLAAGPRFYGVYPAVVSGVTDPDGQGRVRIRLPWSPDGEGNGYEAWARLSTLMAGAGRGTWFVPDVDDEVVVVFEAGDPRRPYVIGALWNGQDAPPETMGSGNDIRAIHSRNGVVITLDDADGRERLRLETPGGRSVTLTDAAAAITAEDGNGNSVTLDAGGVTVQCSARVSLTASTVEMSAGSVTVNAGMARFSGVLQADTVITNSVVSASYTPGAGNIW